MLTLYCIVGIVLHDGLICITPKHTVCWSSADNPSTCLPGLPPDPTGERAKEAWAALEALKEY